MITALFLAFSKWVKVNAYRQNVLSCYQRPIGNIKKNISYVRSYRMLRLFITAESPFFKKSASNFR